MIQNGKFDELDVINSLLSSTTKYSVAVKQLEKRFGGRNVLIEFAEQEVKEILKETEKKAKEVLKGYPIWEKWLKNVPGVGIKLAVPLIKYIRPIERFPNPSKLIVYAGFAIKPYCAICGKDFEYNQKDELIRHLQMEHGIKENFMDFFVGRADINRKSKLKPVLFNIADSMIKRPDTFYREQYNAFKNEIRAKYIKMVDPADAVGQPAADNIGKKSPGQILEETDVAGMNVVPVFKPVLRPVTATVGMLLCEDVGKVKAGTVISMNAVNAIKKEGKTHVLVVPTKKGIDMQARRKLIKLFLSHLWEVWRKLEGLPVVLPYPVKMGMHEYIPPPYWED